MKLLIDALKGSVAIGTAALVLSVLAYYLPDIGIAAACAVGALGLITLKWPLPSIWINYGIVSVLVTAVAVVAIVTSSQRIAEHKLVQENETKAANEVRLVKLRAADSVAYLGELKAANDPRWEREFEVLDKSGYEKFIADRRAKEEQTRKDAIASLLEQAKSVPASDLEVMLRVYSKLSELDPQNRDFRTKRENFERQSSLKIAAQSQLEMQQRNPLQFVSLERFTWSKGGFDNVMIANFSIKNNLPWPIKDIEIKCTHTAPSGTRIDQNTKTVFERVEANKLKRITNFNMGFIHSQASRSGCDIVNVVSIR